MYIDRDSRGFFQLLEMGVDDFKALLNMIKGAGLEERRKFNTILQQAEGCRCEGNAPSDAAAHGSCDGAYSKKK